MLLWGVAMMLSGRPLHAGIFALKKYTLFLVAYVNGALLWDPLWTLALGLPSKETQPQGWHITIVTAIG